MRRQQKFRIKMLGGEYATNMSCRDANCSAWRGGWLSVLDVHGTPAHADAANWIKRSSGRRYIELPSEGALEYLLTHELDLTVTQELRDILGRTAPNMVVFIFPSGQQCFREHLDREVVFAHDAYVHANPRDFNEDMNIEGDKINRLLKSG